MHKLCMLLLAVIITVLPSLFSHLPAIAFRTFLRIIATHASAIASASAVAFTSALVGHTETLSQIGTFIVPVLAAA
eukprot:2832656-Pleurochrysis_carterae.AAC.1